MEEQEQPSSSVAKKCESSEGGLGIDNQFTDVAMSNADAPLEMQPNDCSSESNSCSTPTKNDSGICSKGDEQIPSSSAPKSDNFVSPIVADSQHLNRDEDKIMEEVTASNELGNQTKNVSIDEDVRMLEEDTVIKTEGNNIEANAGNKVAWSRSARRGGRNYRRSSGTTSQDEDEDTTDADEHDVNLQNTGNNSEEPRPLPTAEASNESLSNTENPSGVENFHAARSPADNATENSTSSVESSDSRFSHFPFDTSGSSFNDEDDDDSDMSDNVEQANILSEVLNKPKPSYTWNLTYELMRRENGLSRDGRRSLRSTVASGFNTRFYSSRHVVERMKLSECLVKHNGCVNSLHFDRSGKLLCSGSDDTRIIVWNWAQKKPKIVFNSGHTENIFQTKFINSSGHLDIVSASRDGQVRRAIISSDGAKPKTSLLYRHNGPVHKIVTSPCDPYEIISAGEDGHIRCKDIRCNAAAFSICKVENQIRKRKVRLFSIAHHPFSPQICVSGCDNFVRVFDKRNMQERVHEMCPTHLVDTSITQVTCAVYNSTGTEVLASYSDDDIYLFNNVEYKTGDYLHRYIGHYNHKTIKGVNFFGPNSEYVISGSDCGNIFFWDKNTEAIVNFIPGDTMGVVNCLEPHPMIPVLATSGLDHNIKIWTPCSQIYPPDLSKLEACVKRNLRCSALEKRSEFDDRRFNSFIRQFLNIPRRRVFGESVDLSSSSSSSSSSDSLENDCPQVDGIQCHTQ